MADLKLMRRGVVLGKTETTYGQDAAPGTTNGLLCTVPTVSFSGNRIERNFMRTSLSPYGFVYGGLQQSLSYQAELKGPNNATTPTTPTALDAHIKACAFTSRQVTCIPVSGGTGTFVVGETVTGGTSNANGKFLRIFNGKMHLHTVTGTFTSGETVTGGTSAATRTVGTNPMTDKRLEYYPVSLESSQSSITLYYYMDGILHKMVGSRGTLQISLDVNGYPSIQFDMTGFYATPTTASNPSNVAFETHYPPRCLAAKLSIGTYEVAGAESVSFNVNNTVSVIPDINSETGISRAVVSGRSGSFQTAFNVDLLTNFDPFTIFENGSKQSIGVEIGELGNRVAVFAPYVQLEPPSYSEKNGVAQYNISGLLTGEDDELYIQTG